MERDVFEAFAESVPLPIRKESIEKRHPPEPDIVCQQESGGGIAFELVELTDSITRKMAADTSAHREYFNDAITTLDADAASEFRERYAASVVSFSFENGCSLRSRKKGITEVVKFLAAIPKTVCGNVPLPGQGIPAISAVTIRPCGIEGPVFDDTTCVAFKNSTTTQIRDKLTQRYQTQFPLELLAYHSVQSPLPKNHWCPTLLAMLKEELPGSQFQRVWVFDKNARRILLAWPDARPGMP